MRTTMRSGLLPTTVIVFIVMSNTVSSFEPRDEGQCYKRTRLASTQTSQRVSPVLESWETYLLLLVGFCGFSVLLALLYNGVRSRIFKDTNNLDISFDAGGRVTLSLTAVTVATQLLWPADFLQSATIATANGIAGPFWYAVGVVINILIFPTLSLYFKTRAPGAKTYLQVIYARFGPRVHKVYCGFALLTNLVVTTCLILAGRSTVVAITGNASDEMVVILLALIFGSYAFIGGLGTTFYVSYFNGCIIFIMIIAMTTQMYYIDRDFGEFNSTIGTVDKLYDALVCLQHTGNQMPNFDSSYVTFRSTDAFIFGVIGTFVASSVTFCDQASWQIRIAAKPTQGVIGFLIAGFVWYAMPSTLTTTTGLAYLALSSANNHTHLLSDADISAGFVTPFIAQLLLGKYGGIMILSMVSMALMSTGSGEVMAISSIIIYDIYQKYIDPFRESLPSAYCPLCAKLVASAAVDGVATSTVVCRCVSPSRCIYCLATQHKSNSIAKKSTFRYERTIYGCPTHGAFRVYQDKLIRFKDWTIMWTSLALIPFGLAVTNSGIDLTWAFTTGAVLTIPFCPAVFLSIVWVKTTGTALIVGGMCGVLSGVIVTLSVAATAYDNGLSDFVVNTSQDWSVLCGCCASFSVSLVMTIAVSLCTHAVITGKDVKREWAKTMAINNPLNPWETKYQEDFKANIFIHPPTHDELAEKFRVARFLAYGGGLFGLVVLLLIVPGTMASRGVLEREEFKSWIHFCHIWTWIAGGFVVIFPPIQEMYIILRQYMRNRKSLDVNNDVICAYPLEVETNNKDL